MDLSLRSQLINANCRANFRAGFVKKPRRSPAMTAFFALPALKLAPAIKHHQS